jgi:metallophosphoesterase superfamily enzyme
MKTPAPSCRQPIAPGWWLDSRLAAYWETEAALVVTDLHLGYALRRQAAGHPWPDPDPDEPLRRLEALASDWSPRQWIFLGDVVDGPEGWPRFLAWVQTQPRPVRMICGNHDRVMPDSLERATRLEHAGHCLHHGDRSDPVAEGIIEVTGHHHPAWSFRSGPGQPLKVPAAITSARRIILPGFSRWAAGVAWNDRLQEGETVWTVTARRIWAAARG